jgi:radical SAM protein with 4Fe4S-binding SPASM domain
MNIPSGMLNVETTNRCPARCTTCPREEFKSKLGIMNMNLFKKIVDDCAHYDNLVSMDLCGFGEAYSDMYLLDRLKYVREKLPNAKNYISTNAYLLEYEEWVWTTKLVDTLKFSIFGLSEKSYYAMHKLDRTRAYSNILGYLEYARKLEKKPYTIGLFIETEINKHEKEDWIKFWEPLLDEIYVWLPHNWCDYRNYRVVDKTKQTSCGRPINGALYVHIDGTVSPCCWDINKRLPIGNMNTQTIEEIYNSKEYKYIHDKHLNNNFEGLICSKCDQTNYNPEVLTYASNPNRKVGMLAPTLFNVKEGK